MPLLAQIRAATQGAPLELPGAVVRGHLAGWS